MIKPKQKQTLQTAIRTGLALTCFSDHEPELRVSRLGNILKIPSSTAHRILASLEVAGLVEQDPNTKRYHLSWHMFVLGNTVLNSIGIGGEIDAVMRSLADICNETVNLGVRSANTVMYIRKIESSEILKADTPVGSLVPLHCTAIGKVLLAHLSEELREMLILDPLKRWTKHTLVDRKELENELILVQERGLAFDNEEFLEGVRGMACPIRNYQGNVIAGLSIGAPSSRFTEERISQLEPEIKKQANLISSRLGCPSEVLIPGTYQTT
jgi:IclR family KDG regulon transcriptional repressor